LASDFNVRYAQPQMRTPGPALVYVTGIAFFCAMDAFMKALVADNSALSSTFWRYAAALIFVLPFWWHEGFPPIRREMLPIHGLRAVIGSVSAVAFFWALTIIPLAEAVTIAFIAPLLIPPFAALLLKERMEARNLLAGAAGFLGVLVAVGFEPVSLSPERLLGVAAVLGSATAYALVIVITRLRAARDGPSVLTLLNAAFSALILGCLLAASEPPGAWVPEGREILLVAGVGLTGAVALQLIARAYAGAEAQRLAPFEYTALFWAALFGYAVFGEPVPLRTFAGAAIIIAACLWQLRRPEHAPA
jgi:S-adenosylmethionine uptake transporter